MSGRPTRWFKLGLMLLATGMIIPGRADAQEYVAEPGRPLPTQGGWAEVLTVTPKWLVLQTQEGQQLPVAFDSIQVFVMRWPTTLEQVSPDALVEATGIDLNSGRIQTDHVDVFEGNARSLVTPTVQPIIGYGRIPSPNDVYQMNPFQQNAFLYNVYQWNMVGYMNPLLPGENMIPRRLHLVGLIAGLDPLRIAAPGNTAVAVLPSETGLFVSQVTPGTQSMVRRGDLVFYQPVGANAKGLALGQLVVYKSIPLSQFTR